MENKLNIIMGMLVLVIVLLVANLVLSNGRKTGLSAQATIASPIKGFCQGLEKRIRDADRRQDPISVSLLTDLKEENCSTKSNIGL